MGKAFRKDPRPDDEVVDILERVLASARKGYVRAIVVVAMNPINDVELGAAGDLSALRINVLIGGLAQASNQLTERVRKLVDDSRGA